LARLRLPAGFGGMDAFDREIITSVHGISGSDVRDMMQEAVERRFDAVQAPHPFEHLSDNGSPYTAKWARDFAAALNLAPCFTSVKNPRLPGEKTGTLLNGDCGRPIE
jgi:transposase InsO family protein